VAGRLVYIGKGGIRPGSWLEPGPLPLRRPCGVWQGIGPGLSHEPGRMLPFQPGQMLYRALAARTGTNA
jgi:hypothetical protein